MDLVIDENVKTVAEFMQRNIPASQLIAVANCIKSLAPILWGEYETESVVALRLHELPIGLPHG